MKSHFSIKGTKILPCSFNDVVEWGPPCLPGSALKSPRTMMLDWGGRDSSAASRRSRDSLNISVHPERLGRYTEKTNSGVGES